MTTTCPYCHAPHSNGNHSDGWCGLCQRGVYTITIPSVPAPSPRPEGNAPEPQPNAAFNLAHGLTADGRAASPPAPTRDGTDCAGRTFVEVLDLMARQAARDADPRSGLIVRKWVEVLRAFVPAPPRAETGREERDLVVCGTWRHGAVENLPHVRTKACERPRPAASPTTESTERNDR
jgi:hypothetical protein